MTKKINLFYFREKGGLDNFGDALSPMIIERLSGRKVVWSHVRSSDLVSIGSLLEGVRKRIWQRRFFRPLTPLRIWGAGAIRPGGSLDCGQLIYCSVRGTFTRKRISTPDPIAIGDPGLLIGRLFERKSPRLYRWAIVPHITDRFHAAIKEIHNATPGSIVVNLLDTPAIVIDQLNSSDFVYSTSLHGLVAANALGKPFLWGCLNDKVSGGEWKFRDYFSVFPDADYNRMKLPTEFNFTKLEDKANLVDLAHVDRVCTNLEYTFREMGF
jgi:hypothetical protein